MSYISGYTDESGKVQEMLTENWVLVLGETGLYWPVGPMRPKIIGDRILGREGFWSWSKGLALY